MTGLKKTLSRLSGRTLIPLDLAAGVPEIRISGLRTLVLEPHRGVRAFAGDCILISTDAGLLCVRGRGLSLKSMSERELRLSGEIIALELVDAHAD